MGFFSWNCKVCRHSVREGRGWMSKAVVQGEDGSTATGRYDGYGRLDGSVGTIEVADMDGRFAMFHQTCFKLAGRPEFNGVSESADDQGMPPSDEFPEPRHEDDLRALRELADERTRKARADAKRYNDCREAERKLLGAEVKCSHCGFDTFFVVEKKGSLAIRCPNRDCKRLRPFPAERVEAWRSLAAEYADQPVIWDDRKVGPHFAKVEQVRAQIQQYEEELKTFPGDEYVLGRLADLRSELEAIIPAAEAAEAEESA